MSTEALTKAQELLPCPFCGGEGALTHGATEAGSFLSSAMSAERKVHAARVLNLYDAALAEQPQ